jgi:hypothetical protein
VFMDASKELEDKMGAGRRPTGEPSLASRVMVASQGRRPGSLPSDTSLRRRETTVAGQRRVLTGLRCVCDSSTS